MDSRTHSLKKDNAKMQDFVIDFAVWLAKFLGISLALLLGVRLLSIRMRVKSRKSNPDDLS
jgi:hypothetical protein